MWLPTICENSAADDFGKEEKMLVSKQTFYRSLNTDLLILVVEMDEDTRLMMKYLLEMWKHRVIETAEIDEALHLTELRQPDFILFSGSAQTGGSLTTIRRMRELSSGQTGIIFISAFSETAVRASALAAGADDFLIKPIDFGRLELKLQKHLEKISRLDSPAVGEVL